MSITNGIKFFYKNRLDISKSPSISVSSTEAFANYIADRSNGTYWESTGSDDTTTETIEIQFDSDYEIDRVNLIKNNFKSFDVMYDDSGTWKDFTNVVTKEGTQSDVTETTNTKDTNYYEFTAVTTQKIRIRIYTTQTVDAEKKIYQFITTKEIGTFEGFHVINDVRFGKARTINRTISGKGIVEKNIGAISTLISFNTASSDNDNDIRETLDDFAESFLVYLCGGNEDQFRNRRKGFRLEDIYLVQVDADMSSTWTNNLYNTGINGSISLLEVVN